MKITITKKIGKSTLSFQVDEGKDFDAMYKAAVWADTPEKCGICGKDDVQLDSNKASKDGKEYKFVKVKCNNCGARSPLGQNTDGVNYYWKDWEAYKSNGETKKDNTEITEAEMDDIAKGITG